MQTSPNSYPRRPIPRFQVFALALLVIVTLAEFVLRGPLSPRTPGDFASPYVSASRFLQGKNPYTPEHFRQDWYARGAAESDFLDDWGARPVYPPTALFLLSPLSLLSWISATRVYRLLCCIFYAILVFKLSQRIGFSWNSPLRLFFISFAFALASIQTGIRTGNLSVAAFLLCAFSMLLLRKRSDVAAGILLAAGCCLKPTMALSFLAIPIIYQRTRAIVSVAASTALVAALSMVRLLRLPSAWRLDYAHNISGMFATNGVASFADANLSRFDLLNFEVPIYSLSHSTLVAVVVSYGVVTLLAASTLVSFLRRRGNEQMFWLYVAIFALLGLIPIYQRTYNGVLVIFAVFWCCRHFSLRVSKMTLGCCAVFLLPGQALLRAFTSSRLSPAFRAGRFWSGIVMPHASWAILAIVSLLIYASFRSDFRETEIDIAA